MKLHIAASLSLLLLLAVGCEKEEVKATDASTSADAAEAADRAANAETTAEAEGEATDTGEADDLKAGRAATTEAATKAVADYDAANLPEGVEAKEPLEMGLSWTDDGGENLLVFTQTIEGKSEDASDTTAVATHWQKPADGEWKSVHSHTREVLECTYDGGVTPFVSGWSLSDVDDDSVYEVTFAWTSGCRSDMSPISHQVVMAEGTEKWALEGMTAVTITGEEPVAGEIEDDSAFEGASAAMREHADNVWYETSNEMRARQIGR